MPPIMRPSVVAKSSLHSWHDETWLEKRKDHDWLKEPMSIYEVHFGSWQRDEKNNFLTYKELAHRLVPYVKELGFTHIELLPVSHYLSRKALLSWGISASY